MNDHDRNRIREAAEEKYPYLPFGVGAMSDRVRVLLSREDFANGARWALESEAELERFRALLEGTKTEMCAVRYADGSVPLEPQSDYAHLTRAELAEIGLTRFIVDTNTGEQCESEAKPQDDERIWDAVRALRRMLVDYGCKQWDELHDTPLREMVERVLAVAAPEPPSSDAPANAERVYEANVAAVDAFFRVWNRGPEVYSTAISALHAAFEVARNSRSVSEGAPSSDEDAACVERGFINVGHRLPDFRPSALEREFRAGFRAGQARQRPEITHELIDVFWQAYTASSFKRPSDPATREGFEAVFDVLYGERNADAKGGM